MSPAEHIAQLEAQVAALRAELESVVSENAALRTAREALELEIEKLRRELGRHSGNSGKPPSSDTVAQRQEQNEKRKSRQERRREARARLKELTATQKRKPGKQPGAPGATLNKVDDPDFTEMHIPEVCCGCGGSLADAETVATEVRQVHDLPTRRLEVTEHRAESRRCACGQVTKAPFPKEARSTACYGPLVRAVAVYLMICQHVPVARCAQLLAQVLGAPVSTGWLASLADEAATGLAGFLEVLRAELVASDVLHADETSTRVSGAAYWFHVACTDLLTLLECHEKRGVEAMTDIGVLPLFEGILVSDGLRSYWSIGTMDHALCVAHLLRDLAAVSDASSHREWADDMADLLVDAIKTVDAAVADGADALQPNVLKSLRSRYTKILNRGFDAVPAYHSPGSANRDAYNLLVRLRDQRDEVTRYWSDFRVDPTNNQAERDLRMAKLQRKIAGCFRTFSGAKAFCAVRSYIHTAQKHGLRHLDVLVQLFKDEPWMPPAGASP